MNWLYDNLHIILFIFKHLFHCSSINENRAVDRDYSLIFCNEGGNEEDEQNPVRKALRRAEARPKNLAKSMEDITASAAPREHGIHY